ncbi:hypothetical protein [Pseudonocardia sp. ICBG1142]|uniref:hypothetical protein n=1 Tax=Pseudonocardia sp. ICBG1142 TaxID=2846760 RepID=UPI001CF6A9D7|nr:hypothetical protein [Pseudonocardia sp. ICBG1142]
MGDPDGFAGEGDPEPGSVVVAVVVDLQAQSLEQASGQLIRQRVEVAGPDGEHVDQVGAGPFHLHAAQVLGPFTQSGLLGAEFLAATADIGQQVRVEVVGDLDGPQQRCPPLLDVGHRRVHRRHLPGVLGHALAVALLDRGPQEFAAVVAEHVPGQEVPERTDDQVLGHPQAPRMPVGHLLPPFRCARVVRSRATGLAEHPARTASTAAGEHPKLFSFRANLNPGGSCACGAGTRGCSPGSRRRKRGARSVSRPGTPCSVGSTTQRLLGLNDSALQRRSAPGRELAGAIVRLGPQTTTGQRQRQNS